MTRTRASLGLLAALLAAAVAAPALGQDYPSKPIKFIVPTAPAGVGDIVARLLAQKFNELSPPVTIVVENRPGAAGVIGTNEVARAPADGYTFLVGNHAVLTMLPHLQKIPYDPIKGFAPVFLAGDGAEHPGGAPVGAGERRQGADRLRQGQSRQADLRLAGRRRLGPHRRRAVQAADRHRHHARAVQGRGAGGAGPGRRPCQHDVRRGVAGARADPGRPRAAARRHHQAARGRAAGRADHDRDRHADGDRRLVRPARAGRHAARRNRLAQPRGRQGVRGAGRQRPLRQAGRGHAAAERPTISPSSSRRNPTATAR